MKYDLIIIGAGSGGFAAAIQANELGAKTLLINSGLPLGGTCVNVGCVPSKFLIHKAKINVLKNNSLNFAKVIEEELNLVNELRKEKYEEVLKNLKNVDFIEGKAKFVSENEIEINGQRFQAEKFIIANGSTANVPEIKNIENVGYLNHITALQNKNLPKSIVVIGAGPVGLEFAQIYSRFGSKVTILQKGNSIFPSGEKELTQRLKEILEREGIEIKLNVDVREVRKEGNEKVVKYLINGKEQEIKAEEILLAAGKTPNTQELDLEKAKVKINERKAIITNEFLQTTNDNIYAIGDVNDKPLRLETTAAKEGTIAVLNALENKKIKIDYNSVPYTIFTDPELAGIGFTEERQLKELNVCACRVLELKFVPKARIIKETEGLIKMLINPKTKEITGIHLLAPFASEIINQGIWLVKNKITIDEVINSMPVFPTISEAIKLCALSFYKNVAKISCCI
ncbi:Mercuric reductase [bacterium HR34]|nr:Mercuric reductase [bacterium HR34]